MASLSPRTYLLVDRASKLAALALIVASLEGIGGSFAPVLGVVGVVVGIATVFVDAEE